MSRKKGEQFEEIFQKTINSGAFSIDKGDLKSSGHLVEIKGTNKKSYRITADLLEKIWNEAFESNKLPMFGIIIDREKERYILKINIRKEMK